VDFGDDSPVEVDEADEPEESDDEDEPADEELDADESELAAGFDDDELLRLSVL
jgi:hypothetical protein